MSLYALDPNLHTGSRTSDDQIQRTDGSPSSGTHERSQDLEVNELLRRKRKAREHKACYPCRQRKVKCDLSRPCQTCRDRDHSELCSYTPPSKRTATESVVTDSQPSNTVTLGRYEFDTLMNKLSGLEEQMSELRQAMKQHHTPNASTLSVQALHRVPLRPSDREHIESYGMHTKHSDGNVEHFGAGSIPAMLSALKDRDNDEAQARLQENLNRSIVPLFGLDEGTTYPFIDLWGLPQMSMTRMQELVKVVPDDTQALRLWRHYRSSTYVLFPGLGDVDKFEASLTEFLVTRGALLESSDGLTEKSVFGQTWYWMALLFAVLASGVQSSSVPRKERVLTSQVYTCCSMECLRIVNFLSRPNPLVVQTLLVLQNVLADNLNAGTAWSMLGLTIRLAHTLGLHQPCTPGTPKYFSETRSRIWWAIVWQDALLSIVYDRASDHSITSKGLMPKPVQLNGTNAFHNAMHRLAETILETVAFRARVKALPDSNVIHCLSDQWIKLQRLTDAAHLLDVRHCETEQDLIEYWYLKLQTSYCIAELYRPALDPKRNMLQGRQRLITALMDTLSAFSGLCGVMSTASRSWATLHRALSAALLLGILGELNDGNKPAIRAVRQFMEHVSDVTADVDPAEMANPVRRGILALYQLDIPGLNLMPDLAAHARPGEEAQTLIQPGGVTTQGDESAHPHSTLNTILWGNIDLLDETAPNVLL